ncbi:hypothetical protein PanWU01x14_075000 [Parasponia andersonii]|uniref:Uncharacterized protein n=1 Tax=Parasponia andersonii TaxID=3476 RepID=A0A2P5DCP2_PARAD|nr:hypothetical protein PanWU01x14_075000 [Parasponia andersonii]
MGVLQRIAIAYLVAALCEIWLKNGDDHDVRDVNVDPESSLLRKYQLQWAVTLMICIEFLLVLYGLHVPDWEYQISTNDQTTSVSALKTFLVKCGVRGDTGPA